MTPGAIRNPAVAGQFYAATTAQLKEEIGDLIGSYDTTKKVLARGCILPHAGYTYSGTVAAHTLAGINLKGTVILLGPNHTGVGAAYSIMPRGTWQTPLGKTPIAEKLAIEILQNSKFLQEDATAHLYEHSLEVEIPFLQYFNDTLSIIPIVFLSDDVPTLKTIGKELAEAISRHQDPVFLVASSDLTHYEPQKIAIQKDKKVIEAVLELDEDKLMGIITQFNISMCGYAPVVVLLSALKALGATSAKLIEYKTSGEATGDTSRVVGYAGITIY